MMPKKRYCFALDLQDDPLIIEKYKEYHQKIPEAIHESIVGAGIHVMDIYLSGNRLFMIMEVDDTFNFEKKAAMDSSNPQVQDWEALMSSLQKPLPWAQEGEKWVLMEKVFSLQKA